MPARWIIPLQVFRSWGAVWLFGWAHHTQPPASRCRPASPMCWSASSPCGRAFAGVGQPGQPPRGDRLERFGFTDIAFGIAVSAAIGLHLIETGFATPSLSGGDDRGIGVPQPALHADGRHLGHGRFLQT
jgi:hypothetical protein